MDVDWFGIAVKGDTKIERVLGGIEAQVGDFTEGAEFPVEEPPRRKSERGIFRAA